MLYHEPTRTNGEPLLHLNGVGRDTSDGSGRSLLLFFNRQPSDDEMRAIHDALRPIVNNNSRGIAA